MINTKQNIRLNRKRNLRHLQVHLCPDMNRPFSYFLKKRYQKRMIRNVKYEVLEDWIKNAKLKLKAFPEQPE